jgi:hypothetical protein
MTPHTYICLAKTFYKKLQIVIRIQFVLRRPETIQTGRKRKNI